MPQEVSILVKRLQDSICGRAFPDSMTRGRLVVSLCVID